MSRTENPAHTLLDCTRQDLTTNPADSKVPCTARDAIRPLLFCISVPEVYQSKSEVKGCGQVLRISEADNICDIEYQGKYDNGYKADFLKEQRSEKSLFG